MADTIQLRAGNKAKIPKLADREVGYVKDENAFYVGTPDGNKKVYGEELERKLEATRAAPVAVLAAEADLAAAISKVNELIETLKAAKIMNT